ncbi:alpha-L-fucosidase, partial [Planctomycetota bacterium]
MGSLKLISTSVLTVFVITAMTACDQTDTTRQIETVSSEQSIVQLAKPTPQQAAWHDAEIGMFIHFGLETWQDKESDDETSMENLKLFNPPNVDTEQWVDVAESIGAKYIILVAKHVGGFCLWQTDSTEYSIKNTAYKNGKGDILAELSETCRRRGMKLGVYIYPGSIFHGAGIGVGGKTSDPTKQEEYDRIYRQQLTEVLSRYGEMYEVWFDGSVTIPVKDILDKYAPNAMVFQGPQATIRWVGNEQGYAPYPAWNSVKKTDAVSGVATARHGDPDGDVWLPNEVDTVIRDHYWFWNSYNEKNLKSLDHLMDIYYKSVGHGSVLLLNIAPDTSGRIPEADVKRAAEFGAEVKRRFEKSIAETKGKGNLVELTLDKPTTIDHVITMEDITEGERVREYLIEGLVDGNWQKIVEGISIGHKKIDRFDHVAVESVRIRVDKSAAKPLIRKLAVYNVSGKDLTVKLARPTPQQTAWHDMELGMFIHFGLWTWPIGVTEDLKTLADVQKKFNPVNLDTDQWVSAAESMGAKYVVFTAKHADGFCMWQTDTTDFSIKNTPWRNGKGDILADLAESCRKRGMKLGVYLNAQNMYSGVGLGGKCATAKQQEKYNKIYRRQLTEVLSRYGDMCEVWFDGGIADELEVGDIL